MMTHAVDVDALVHVAELSLAEHADQRHTLACHLEITPRRRTRVVRVVRLDNLRVIRDTCSRCTAKRRDVSNGRRWRETQFNL